MVKNKPGSFNNYRNREFTSSPEKYTNLVMERIHNAAMEFSLETEPGDSFDAICLSGIRSEDNDGTQLDSNDAAAFGFVQYIKIKPKNHFGNSIPDMSTINDPEFVNFLISTLDEKFIAKSDFLFSSMDSLEFGQIVKCRVVSSMQHRNPLIIYSKPVGDPEYEPGYRELGSLEGLKTAEELFGKGDPFLLGNQNTTEGFLYPGFPALHQIKADRKPGDVKNIVLHVTQGPARRGGAKSTIKWFSDGPTSKYEYLGRENWTCQELQAAHPEEWAKVDNDKYVCRNDKGGRLEKKNFTSIHYCTDIDGEIYQGVAEKDIAQHAGRYNKISIGIEMQGKSQTGPGKGASGLYSQMYTEAHLESVAKLCAQICRRWELEPNRTTIIGHEDFAPNAKIGPGITIGKTSFGKQYGSDTNNYWNWNDFLLRVKKHYGA